MEAIVNNKLPYVTLDLITHLDKFYKDCSPDLSTDIDKIRYNSGQVSVIRYLKKLYNDQQHNMLTGITAL